MNPLLRRVTSLEKKLAPPDNEYSWVDFNLLTAEEGKWLRKIVDRTPLYEGRMDLTLLTNGELEEMARIIKKASPPEDSAPQPNATAPTPRASSLPAR